MAFQRNHVSDAERIEIGLQVFQKQSVYGVATDLARKYVIYSPPAQIELLIDASFPLL